MVEIGDDLGDLALALLTLTLRIITTSHSPTPSPNEVKISQQLRADCDNANMYQFPNLIRFVRPRVEF